MAATKPKDRAYFSKLFNQAGGSTPRFENEAPGTENEVVEPTPRLEVEIAADAGIGPSKKSRKRDKNNRRSHSSKKHRHGSGSSSQSLFETMFTSSTRFSDFVDCNLDSSARDMFKVVSVPSLADSMFELTSRAFLISEAIKEKTKSHVTSAEFEKLKREAAESNEKIALLNSQIDELSAVNNRQETEKEKLKSENVKLSAQTLALNSENQELKGDVAKLTAAKKIDAEGISQLEAEVNKLKLRVGEAESFVIQQHQLGFEKALQQAEYFYKIPLDAGNFDVGKDFYKGELIPVSDIPYDGSPEDERENEG